MRAGTPGSLADNGSVGCGTSDLAARTKYQQSVAELFFDVGLRFWESDVYDAVGREVDDSEGSRIGMEARMEGPTSGTIDDPDEVVTDSDAAGPSFEPPAGGPTPHPTATGPVSGNAGTRGRFARGFGPDVVVAFRLAALV